jgi:hypothetical protein
MAIIEQRLAAMGLELPEPLKVREGLRMPFAWVRVRGNRADISGHVECNLEWGIGETPRQGRDRGFA